MTDIDTAAIRADVARNEYAEPEDTLALCDALDAARAERDYLLTSDAADAMLRDALARAEAAEARAERERAWGELQQDRAIKAEARIAAAIAIYRADGYADTIDPGEVLRAHRGDRVMAFATPLGNPALKWGGGVSKRRYPDHLDDLWPWVWFRANRDREMYLHGCGIEYEMQQWERRALTGDTDA